ncbi:S8 family serine peptidase, partial [bacterium]|nr:S8 family serine peptidase [bacterium]
NYTAGFAGTSAATPHVAGLASLIKSKYSNYTNAQIISVIKSSTDKVSGMSGQDFTNEYGFGRININKALSSSYSWELVSWNANKSLIGLSPGDTAHITVTAKNTGTTTWLKSTSPAVLLGTNNSKDRSSIFAANGWVNSGRPARLNEDSVLPGSQGVFEFDISVPAKPGTYNEAFSLVAEGITWFNEQNLVIPIKVNGNYSWQFKSQSASKNLVGLSPGEAVTLNLVATNTGDTTWNNSGLGFIALGTTYSRDRLSPFYTQSSWINQARPTKLVEASVPPGQDGTFSWTISVPYGSTVYRENVSLVAEGVTWLNDPGLNYYITVNKIYGWQFVSQSADKNLNGLAVGETAQVTLTARNVGNTTWFRTGKYPFMVGTTYPNDRLSAFNDVSWPNGGRPAALPVDKTFVLPGETVTFSWTIKSPQTVGIYRESVSLVLDGLGWLNDPGLNYYIVVGWADVLEGIPMPATSGLTAREQHLSLSGCAEIPSTHYSISGTLVGDQNGMAWQTSGGCGYGAWGVAPPAADEKYYINMRWNYTSQNGQPIYTNKAWYYRKKIIVINPANGKKLVASVVEYGPGIMSRVSGLSPEAMTALGAVTNSNLEYHWYLNQAAVPGPLN